MIGLIFSLFGLFATQKCDIDSLGMKFVYRGIPVFLLFSSIYIFVSAYFGNPAVCHFGALSFSENEIDPKRLTPHCLNQGTYIYEKIPEGVAHRRVVIYPGMYDDPNPMVDIYPGIRSKTDPEPEVVYHMVYCFMPLIFIVLSLSCFIGRYYWRTVSRDLFTQIKNGLNDPRLTEGQVLDRIRVSNVMFHSDPDFNNYIAGSYGVVLLVNLCVLLLHFVIIDIVLGTSDFHFGLNALSHVLVPYEHWTYAIARSFPLVTICNLKRFGVGGGLELRSGICYLTLNRAVLLVVGIYWCILLIVSSILLVELCNHFTKIVCLRYRNNLLFSKLEVNKKSKIAQELSSLNFGSAFIVTALVDNISTDYTREIAKRLDQ